MIKLAELLGEKATFTSKYDDSPKLKGKQTELPDELQAKLVKEGDHEVAMAQASLKSIIKSAAQLMNKLGMIERDIPGWIQDHITNAENYIDQAAQGFHELNHNEMNEQLKRLQELAGVVNENQSQLSGNGIDAAASAKKALEILLRQTAVYTDHTISNTLEQALIMIDDLLSNTTYSR